MRLWCSAAVLVAALAGCATTTGLAPTSSTSGFDGARVVDIAPHGTVCDEMPCVALGAQWNSRFPESVIVTVVTLDPKFSGIQKATFSIDGKELAFRPKGLTRFDPGFSAVARESRQDFVVPLETLRQIRAAGRVWLRVSTLDGYVDRAVLDGQKDSKAYHAIGRLLAEIDNR